MPARGCKPGSQRVTGTPTDPTRSASGPSENCATLTGRCAFLGQLTCLVAGQRLPQHAVRRWVDRTLQAVERGCLADEHEHRGIRGKACLELVDHRLERALVPDAD